MGRRIPLRSLSFALALAAGVAAVVLFAYDAHGAWITLAIVGPIGVLTVLAGEAIAAHGGGLRRQFVAIAALGLAALASTVALFVDLMFVSGHDAVMTILLVSFAAALVVWTARPVVLRALAEVAREERMRRELFAAVSHDLRTPITALRLLATAIDDEVVEDAKRREYAARMNTHVRALGALIDDLFDLTRLEAKELAWTMEDVRLDQLVQDAVEAMQPTAQAGSVAVRADLRPPLRPSVGNHEQLQRVLFNLIQNAIHHTPPDGSVTVRAEGVDGGVEIEVADTGLGIAPEQRERVFEPFFRGDASRTDPGAGLGLAISRAIVEAHGGRIWLEEAEIGTRVRFRLPLSI
jgi:signal transduction histidine kinase